MPVNYVPVISVVRFRPNVLSWRQDSWSTIKRRGVLCRQPYGKYSGVSLGRLSMETRYGSRVALTRSTRTRRISSEPRCSTHTHGQSRRVEHSITNQANQLSIESNALHHQHSYGSTRRSSRDTASALPAAETSRGEDGDHLHTATPSTRERDEQFDMKWQGRPRDLGFRRHTLVPAHQAALLRIQPSSVVIFQSSIAGVSCMRSQGRRHRDDRLDFRLNRSEFNRMRASHVDYVRKREI